MNERIPVAVLGSGNIGIDLCERLLRDSDFKVVALVGRRADSPGLQRFTDRISLLLSGGIGDLLPLTDQVAGVFDATSAFDHPEHWSRLKTLGIWMIDLTPSRVGKPLVPALVGKSPMMQLELSDPAANYSMVTCGGQSAAGIACAIAQNSSGLSEVEVSSSLAAVSAGPATRLNIDQYVETTEDLLSQVTGCPASKAILVVNPANPPVMMRTTVTLRAESFDMPSIHSACDEVISQVQTWVPGYSLAVPAHVVSPGIVSATVKVIGAGHYLPPYAGNLDIINAAAVETARMHGHNVGDLRVGR